MNPGGAYDAWYAGIRGSPGDSGSLLVESEAGRGTDAAGVITHLAGVGDPTAGTTVSWYVQMPVVGDVALAPYDDIQEGGDKPPDLEVVTAGEDVTVEGRRTGRSLTARWSR